jgi:hypothetical protein
MNMPVNSKYALTKLCCISPSVNMKMDKNASGTWYVFTGIHGARRDRELLVSIRGLIEDRSLRNRNLRRRQFAVKLYGFLHLLVRSLDSKLLNAEPAHIRWSICELYNFDPKRKQYSGTLVTRVQELQDWCMQSVTKHTKYWFDIYNLFLVV